MRYFHTFFIHYTLKWVNVYWEILYLQSDRMQRSFFFFFTNILCFRYETIFLFKHTLHTRVRYCKLYRVRCKINTEYIIVFSKNSTFFFYYFQFINKLKNSILYNVKMCLNQGFNPKRYFW